MDITDLIDKEEIKEALIEKLSDNLIRDIGGDIRQKALSRVEERINAAVDAEVSKVLDGIYQPVNLWGEEDGDKTTIRSRLAQAIGDWWNQLLDSDGKVTISSYRGTPRYKYHLAETVKEVINGALKGEFEKLVKDFREQAKAGLTKVITEAIDIQWKK